MLAPCISPCRGYKAYCYALLLNAYNLLIPLCLSMAAKSLNSYEKERNPLPLQICLTPSHGQPTLANSCNSCIKEGGLDDLVAQKDAGFWLLKLMESQPLVKYFDDHHGFEC
jgi:hypothetical protein